MVAKKLLADDKIQAYAKENVSWVLYVLFWKEKHCLIKQFASLKNVSYWYLNFVVRVTYFFFKSCWLALNQLSRNVLLFSCDTRRLVNFVSVARATIVAL